MSKRCLTILIFAIVSAGCGASVVEFPLRDRSMIVDAGIDGDMEEADNGGLIAPRDQLLAEMANWIELPSTQGERNCGRCEYRVLVFDDVSILSWEGWPYTYTLPHEKMIPWVVGINDEIRRRPYDYPRCY